MRRRGGRGGRATVMVEDVDPPLDPREARALLLALMKRLNVPPRSVTAVFGDDALLRGLNRRFRGRDRPTDVLSFPAGDGNHYGDIAISVDRTREQARRSRRSAAREARILLIHGFLHLLGYDHETDDGEMNVLERLLRREFSAAGGAFR